jgi:hypothetical protein
MLVQRCQARQRSAVAAVEMAVCLPFMVMFLIGIWDVGRLVQIHQAIDNACREGGRQASTGKYTKVEVQEVVRNYLQSYGVLVDNEVLVEVSNNSANETLARFQEDGSREPGYAYQGDLLNVRVVYPFKHVRWVGIDKFLSNATKISVSLQFISMADLPVIVPSDVPAQPFSGTNPF